MYIEHNTVRHDPRITSTRPHRRRARLLAGAAAWFGLCLCAATALSAQDSRWIVRGFAVGLLAVDDEVSVTRPSPDPSIEELTTHGVSDGSGFGAGVEFMVRRRLGAEFAAFIGDYDSDFVSKIGASTLTDTEEIGMEMFMLGINYHFTPRQRVDVYGGIFVAMTNFDDVVFLTEAGRREKLSFDDDFGFGLKLGVDVAFRPGSHWHRRPPLPRHDPRIGSSGPGPGPRPVDALDRHRLPFLSETFPGSAREGLTPGLSLSDNRSR